MVDGSAAGPDSPSASRAAAALRFVRAADELRQACLGHLDSVLQPDNDARSTSSNNNNSSSSITSKSSTSNSSQSRCAAGAGVTGVYARVPLGDGRGMLQKTQ